MVITSGLYERGGEMGNEFPSADMAMTHILVVDDLEAARHFYRDVLGASLYGEYGGTSIVFNFNGAWLLVVTGGGPTADKPDTVFVHRMIRIELVMRLPFG
jgi:catechol 2,3-dioxygenase-like lactoylglutathione lyase family enzyme